jgi:hypothetical protein
LDLNSAAHRINNTRKFCDHAVAGVFDGAASTLLDLRIDEFAEMSLQAFVRPFLIRPHQPRIARDVGGKDRRQSTGRSHIVSPAAKRRPDRNSSRCSGLR